MQEWNAWFRERQSADGRTVEDFARESGLDVRSIAAYRKDRIPRKATLAKIAEVLGDEGPLPKVNREQAASYNQQLGELRARADDILEYHHKLRVRVEALEATLASPALARLLADKARADAEIEDRRVREAGSEPAG